MQPPYRANDERVPMKGIIIQETDYWGKLIAAWFGKILMVLLTGSILILAILGSLFIIYSAYMLYEYLYADKMLLLKGTQLCGMMNRICRVSVEGMVKYSNVTNAILEAAQQVRCGVCA